MSTSLYWRPVPTDPDGEYLGYQLKFILAQYLFGYDGSYRSEWATVDKAMIPFLEGVRAAAGSNEDLLTEAARLIDLISRHDEVQLRTS